MTSLETEGKKISLFGSENTSSPLLILNTYGDEGHEVWNECQKLNCPPFCLAAISNLDWNNELSPWASPALYKNDGGFSGGADSYLSLLTDKIISTVCDSIGAKPSYLVLAGYSLAGLFAIYAAYKTDIFSRIVSFPGFEEYVKSHDFKKKPDCIYLSLGDTEAKAKNKVLATVQDKTESIFELYKSQEIPVIFELNKGNHFTDAALRTAKGIKWILEQ